jgi:hypothetical protein
MKTNLFITLPVILLISSGQKIISAGINPEPVASMEIKYLSDPITLDGIVDAAYPDFFSLDYVLTFTEGQYSGPIDHSVNISMGWRSEGMYLFADVSDDYMQGNLNWDQDGLELKINPDISNDGTDHLWQDDALEIGIESNTDTLFRYYNPNLGYGAAVNGETVSVGHRTGLPGVAFKIIRDGASYKIEALLPWLFFLPPGTSADSVNQWTYKTMGFDIHAADNDGSGRDHALVWDWDGSGTDADASNVNTSLLGSITFEHPANALINAISDAMMLYPNPAQNKVYVENPGAVVSLEFVNLAGQTVKTVPVTTRFSTIDLSGYIISGYYLVKGKDQQGNLVSVSKLVIR